MHELFNLIKNRKVSSYVFKAADLQMLKNI